MRCEVSVVIPTLGQSPHLRGLLERLQRQQADFLFEVLVVANIPQQQLRTLVNSMGTNSQVCFSYLETGRLGVSFARNKGLERARGDIVLFLDDDMILENDTFVAEHAAYHRMHDTATAIGGPYRLTGVRSIWDLLYQKMAHDYLKRHATFDHGTLQLLGGNLSLKRAAVVSNSWSFDDAVGFAGAETGLCTRIAAAGHRLLLFDALEIVHAPQLTARKFSRKAYLQGAGARWIADNCTRPATTHTMTYASFYLPDQPPRLWSHRAVMAIYRRFFEFGWQQDAYSNPKTPGTLEGPRLGAFAFCLMGRTRLLARLRRLHRAIYAGVRSAWLNGESSRRLRA